jgi:hypothetical protein
MQLNKKKIERDRTRLLKTPIRNTQHFEIKKAANLLD